MGIGTRFDEISTDGVTWNYKSSGSNWLDGDMNPQTTGSYNGRGGTWYTGSRNNSIILIRKFRYSDECIISLQNSWVDGTFPNEGFIIKHESSKENDTVDYGQLKFFGKETHTIHQPKIRIGWDDSVFETGSLSSITLTEDIKINCKRLKKSYKVNTTPKIEVHGRELYPSRTFSNTFRATMM